MILNFDENSLSEFLEIVLPKEESAIKIALEELRNYIKNHCVVILRDPQKQNLPKTKDLDMVGDYADKNISLADKHQEEYTGISKNMLDFNDSIDKKRKEKYGIYRQWFTGGGGDSPNTFSTKDKYAQFTSISFVNDKSRSESGVKEFVNSYIIGNQFVVSKLRYTGETTGWSSLITHKLPITEIIVVDPYLFNFDSKKEEEPNSTYKLLEELIGENENVNVLFFCNPPKLMYNKGTKKVEVTPNYGDVYNNLKDKYREKNIKFLVILHHSQDKEGKLHDRYIITNNAIYMSGHSFVHYFPSKKESLKCQANGSVGFSIHSFLDPETEKVLGGIVENLSENILKHLKRGEIFGDGYEGVLFDDFKNKIPTCQEWSVTWSTDIYEGIEVEIKSEKIETKEPPKYRNRYGNCRIPNSTKDISGLVSLHDIRPYDKDDNEFKFFAKYKIIT